jgi:hypothetical protein
MYGYAKPASTYLGTYFNTGSYFTANIPDGFGFKFSIVGMWTNIPENQKTFAPNPGVEGVENLSPTATVFGNKASYFLTNDGYFTYPTGFAVNAMPLAIYQTAFSLFNTELMIRYFPKSKFNEVTAGLFGFAIKHEITSHFSDFPVDISVQLLFNNLEGEYSGKEVNDYGKITSNNFAANTHISSTFSEIFIIYTGLQYEASSMDVTYYYKDTKNFHSDLGKKMQQINIDGENKFRFTLGSAIKLDVFVFNVDLNLTKFTTFSSGISLDF